ncbi:unnamed protein product [Lymnaea stagnalis]|uniref:Uncharacterized protein n=1 Tax=Lymnaea stagnalis TaxID=6523 RepID=A0AAV2GZ29_LYMST
MRRCRSCSPRPKRCCPPLKCSCVCCSPDCCVPSRRARSFSPIKRYVSCPPCDPSDPCDPCYPINCPRRKCKTYPSSILCDPCCPPRKSKCYIPYDACDPCCPPRKSKCYIPYDACDPCYPKKGKCYPCYPRGVDSFVSRKCDPCDPCYSFRPKRCDPCDPCVPKKCFPCDPCKPRRCDPWDPCDPGRCDPFDPCDPCVPRRRDSFDPCEPRIPCDPCLPRRRKPCYPCDPCYPRKVGPCDPCFPRCPEPCDPCVPRRRYPCDPCYPRRRDPCDPRCRDPCDPCDPADPCYPRRRKPCYPCGPRRRDPCDPCDPCEPCDPYYPRWRDACDPCYPRIRDPLDPCDPRRRYPCDPCDPRRRYPCDPYGTCPPFRCSTKCDDFFRSRCPVCLQLKCICLKSYSADDCKEACPPLSCDPFNKTCYPCGEPARCAQDSACCPINTSSGEAVCQETRVGTDDRCGVDGPSKDFLQKSRCLGKCMSRYQPHFCPWEADISVSGTIRAHCNSTAVEVAKRMTGRFKSDGERYTTDSCAKLPANRLSESQQMSLGVLDDGTNLDFSRNNRKLSEKQKNKDTIVLNSQVNRPAKDSEKAKASAPQTNESSLQKAKRKKSKTLPLPCYESDDADVRSDSMEGVDRFYETSVSHDGGIVRKKVDLDMDRQARSRSDRVRRILEASDSQQKDTGREVEQFVARRSHDKASPSKNNSHYLCRNESPHSVQHKCEHKPSDNRRCHSDDKDGEYDDVSDDIKNFLRLRKRHWLHSSSQRRATTHHRSPSVEQDNTPPGGVCSKDGAAPGRCRRRSASQDNEEVSSDDSQTVLSTRRQHTASHPEEEEHATRTVFRKVQDDKHSHCRNHRR